RSDGPVEVVILDGREIDLSVTQQLDDAEDRQRIAGDLLVLLVDLEGWNLGEHAGARGHGPVAGTRRLSRLDGVAGARLTTVGWWSETKQVARSNSGLSLNTRLKWRL